MNELVTVLGMEDGDLTMRRVTQVLSDIIKME